jgi:hypothetical protein
VSDFFGIVGSIAIGGFIVASIHAVDGLAQADFAREPERREEGRKRSEGAATIAAILLCVGFVAYAFYFSAPPPSLAAVRGETR